MGLTNSSTGFFVAGERSEKCGDYIVALAGNPNVGKSTVFNALTGLKQHTGNWPGKTVGNAVGKYLYKGKEYSLVDVPGTYSLLANSAEEEIARDFLCFGDCDCRIITVDATCLERNLNLVCRIRSNCSAFACCFFCFVHIVIIFTVYNSNRNDCL